MNIMTENVNTKSESMQILKIFAALLCLFVAFAFFMNAPPMLSYPSSEKLPADFYGNTRQFSAKAVFFRPRVAQGKAESFLEDAQEEIL